MNLNNPDKQNLEDASPSKHLLSNFYMPEPGTFIGKYELLEQIGVGGMSIVFKAQDKALNRLVAIKFLLPQSNTETINLLRFQQEARAASSLEHPNIVKIYDFSTTSEGIPFLVMSYLDGVSLADAIKIEGSLPISRWLSIMIQACDALEHAHQNGIIHRDIKPGNFVLAQEKGTEVLKLVDFGIAKNSFDDMSLTKTGDVFGSPLYMSPEQCSGLKLDLRSDIYSLGCVMYEALTGRPPLSGDNSLSTMQKHIGEKPEPLQKLRPGVKNIASIDRIVMRCLEKKPEARYQDLGVLRNELNQIFVGQSLTNNFSPRRIAASLGLLALFTITSCWFYMEHKTPPASKPGQSESLSAIATPKARDSAPKESMNAKDEVEKKTKLDSLLAQANYLITHGNSDAALRQLNESLQLATELGKPATELAPIIMQIANCERDLKILSAGEHYEQALHLVADADLPPDLIVQYDCQTQLGNLALNRGNPEQAKPHYENAYFTAVKQRNIEHQALSFEKQGACSKAEQKLEECKKEWTTALKIMPNNPKLLDKLNELLRRQGKPEITDANVRSSLNEADTVKKLYAEGESFLKAESYKQAEEKYKQALQQIIEHKNGPQQMAVILSQLGQAESRLSEGQAAKRDFLRALYLVSGSDTKAAQRCKFTILVGLGRQSRIAGDMPKAKKYYSQLYEYSTELEKKASSEKELKPIDGLKADALAQLGECSFAEHDFAECAKYWRQSIEIRPNADLQKRLKDLH